MIQALSNQTNNNYLLLYLGWLIKSTITLHKLINNKLMIKEIEEKKVAESKEAKKEVKENTVEATDRAPTESNK